MSTTCHVYNDIESHVNKLFYNNSGKVHTGFTILVIDLNSDERNPQVNRLNFNIHCDCQNCKTRIFRLVMKSISNILPTAHRRCVVPKCNCKATKRMELWYFKRLVNIYEVCSLPCAKSVIEKIKFNVRHYSSKFEAV